MDTSPERRDEPKLTSKPRQIKLDIKPNKVIIRRENFIYTANNNIWKSSTKGNTWTKISNLPTPAGANKPLKINALALYPKNSSVI
mgnify:CR=1 FL=1